MKKLLVATSALVAAGSAAALDVTLGGEIKSVVSYDGSAANATTSGWTQSGLASTLSVGVSGEGMGWTYGGSLDAGTGNASSMYIGNAAFGTLTLKNSGCGDFVDLADPDMAGTPAVQQEAVIGLSGTCMEWSTGASLMGFGVNVATNLADAQGNAVLGLTGDLAGMAVAAEVNAATSAMDATVSTSVGSTSVGLEVQGKLNDLSDASYVAKLSTSALGFDLGLTADNSTLGFSAGMGGLTFKGALGDGDLLNNLGVEYSATLADGLSTKAAVASVGSAYDLTVTTTLSF